MPFITTKMINRAYYQDEFILKIVYGPLGIGKSSFAIKVGAEVYGSYEKVKEYVVFHPRDFVEKCLTMSKDRKREKLLIWDDAGLWLFYKDFNDPFVQAVLKYMNVARTNWACIILTTPTPAWVQYKLRNFPQSTTIKIIKQASDQDHKGKPRLAKAYRSWVAPDFRKRGVRLLYMEQFNAMLPNDFFFDWYKPLREQYAVTASEKMNNLLERVKTQGIQGLPKTYQDL